MHTTSNWIVRAMILYRPKESSWQQGSLSLRARQGGLWERRQEGGFEEGYKVDQVHELTANLLRGCFVEEENATSVKGKRRHQAIASSRSKAFERKRVKGWVNSERIL